MKPWPPPEEPIGLLAAAVRHEVRKLVERRADGFGLSSHQFWILVGIAERPCHSQAELAKKLRIDEATACRVTRALAARRLVRSVRDERDRRRIKLALTAEGERLAARLLPIARDVRAAVESALDPGERAATRAALVKIVTFLRRIPDDAPAAHATVPARRRRARSGAARASSA